MQLRRYVPKHEYISDFLFRSNANELLAKLETVRGLILETGACDIRKTPPTHATIQWGARQAYLNCVPKPFRAKSSGDIPEWLLPLKTRLEQKYRCIFNSIQVNKHFNQNAVVQPHSDSPAGHICMVSVGAERDFVLRRRKPFFTEFARYRLAHGSLLTFFPKDQWRHSHEMPKSETPCGARYALVFRYISEVLTEEGSLTKRMYGTAAERKDITRQRDEEYERAQAGMI